MAFYSHRNEVMITDGHGVKVGSGIFLRKGMLQVFVQHFN